LAPLTTAAHAARRDSRRLRNEAQGLKLVVRGTRARSRQRLDKAHVEADRARASREVPVASPWSSLEWGREDEQLRRVLVPLD
jgi:hypothetical protein